MKIMKNSASKTSRVVRAFAVEENEKICCGAAKDCLPSEVECALTRPPLRLFLDFVIFNVSKHRAQQQKKKKSRPCATHRILSIFLKKLKLELIKKLKVKCSQRDEKAFSKCALSTCTENPPDHKGSGWPFFAIFDEGLVLKFL